MMRSVVIVGAIFLLMSLIIDCRPVSEEPVSSEKEIKTNLSRSTTNGARQFISLEPLLEERSKKIASSSASGSTRGDSSSNDQTARGRQFRYYPIQYQLTVPEAQYPSQTIAYQPESKAYSVQYPVIEASYVGAYPQNIKPGSEPLTSWSRQKGYRSSYGSSSQSKHSISSEYKSGLKTIESRLPVLKEVYELEYPEIKVFTTKSLRKNSNPYKTVVTFKSIKHGIAPLEYEKLLEPEFYVQEEAVPKHQPTTTYAPEYHEPITTTKKWVEPPVVTTLPPKPIEVIVTQEPPKKDIKSELLDKVVAVKAEKLEAAKDLIDTVKGKPVEKPSEEELQVRSEINDGLADSKVNSEKTDLLIEAQKDGGKKDLLLKNKLALDLDVPEKLIDSRLATSADISSDLGVEGELRSGFQVQEDDQEGEQQQEQQTDILGDLVQKAIASSKLSLDASN